MVDHILVPLDGTDFSEHALPHAVAIARQTGASIHLATVEVPPPMAFPDVNFLEPLSDAELRYLNDAAERVRAAGVAEVSVEVLTGNAPEALELHREEIGAELTVMSTHGRGPLSRAWLGSVADRFVRHSEAPVLMVRPRDEPGVPDLATLPSVDRIVVTLDGSDLSETAVEPATGFARLFGAAITLARIVEYPHETESVYLPHAIDAIQEQLEESREAAHTELERVAAQIADEGIEVGQDSRVANHAPGGILEVADEVDADLIVMASHGRGGLDRVLLGSVADKVLRGSDRPVLIVRAG